MRVVYDLETYPNCFLFAAEFADVDLKVIYEISDRVNQGEELYKFLTHLETIDAEMIGFNNLAFDYPIIHELMKMKGKYTADMGYAKCDAIINGNKDERFKHMVYTNHRFVRQLDLLKINHFDNKAKMTSLKSLEFNMKSYSIQDLPFPPGTHLTFEEIDLLRFYNQHDVSETKKFYHECKDMIAFRSDLTFRHQRDFMNHSDVKIGTEIFQMALEQVGVTLYDHGPDGRKPRQTIREHIVFSECMPDIKFENVEFQRMWHRISRKKVKETKNVFKNHTVDAYGVKFVFGTGGLHASVDEESFKENNEYMILDVDVAAMYPSIAIANRFYPEHLGPKFVEVYRHLRDERNKYKKGTSENAMLKLANNGSYGQSNNPYSIFYDPRFTMQITITGQFALAKLSEMVMFDPRTRLIQANTDGITLYMPREIYPQIKAICDQWETMTGLILEEAFYHQMIVADVNSYIAQTTDGKVKRKGRYEYNVQWHQDASALVVPKVAEMHLIDGANIEETIRNWPDFMDFMMRIKVPRSGKLYREDETGTQKQEQNTSRYYVARGGQSLVKMLPPTAKAKKEGNFAWRRFNQESGWKVCVCNNMDDARLLIDYKYYIDRCEKLCLGIL